MKRLALASHFPSLTPALRSLGGGGWPGAARVPDTRVRPKAGPPTDAPARDLGDLAAKIIIVTLFSSMAVRLAQDSARTGHVTGMLLVASEALVVVLTMVRRPAGLVDRTMKARLLTAFATFGPPLVRPMSGAAIAPESITVAIASIGLMIVVLGKLSLGRSFGLSPANRGVVCSGLYRFVRHPIYLGYLITHIGFVIANPADWNLVLLGVADVALMLRACREEQTLAADATYRDYMQHVRWRFSRSVLAGSRIRDRDRGSRFRKGLRAGWYLFGGAAEVVRQVFLATQTSRSPIPDPRSPIPDPRPLLLQQRHRSPEV